MCLKKKDGNLASPKIFTLPLGHDGSSLYTLLQNYDSSLLEEAHYFLASLSPISSLAILQHTLEQAQLHPTAYESPKKTCTALHSIKIMTSHMSKGLELRYGFCSWSLFENASPLLSCKSRRENTYLPKRRFL